MRHRILCLSQPQVGVDAMRCNDSTYRRMFNRFEPSLHLTPLACVAWAQHRSRVDWLAVTARGDEQKGNGGLRIRVEPTQSNAIGDVHFPYRSMESTARRR
jgi:hypothetical protein